MAHFEDMPPLLPHDTQRPEEDETEARVADRREYIGRFRHLGAEGVRLDEDGEVRNDVDGDDEEEHSAEPAVSPVDL